jgi:hypothetical protein
MKNMMKARAFHKSISNNQQQKESDKANQAELLHFACQSPP